MYVFQSNISNCIINKNRKIPNIYASTLGFRPIMLSVQFGLHKRYTYIYSKALQNCNQTEMKPLKNQLQNVRLIVQTWQLHANYQLPTSSPSQVVPKRWVGVRVLVLGQIKMMGWAMECRQRWIPGSRPFAILPFFYFSFSRPFPF